MRVTQRYLKEWLATEFKRLEISFPVIDITKIHLRQCDYEAGAAHFVIRIGTGLNYTTVLVPYPLWSLQRDLNNGCELYLRLRDGRYLNDASIEVRKITQPTKL